MGTVWLATRDDGQFERQVALKLLHRGRAIRRRSSASAPSVRSWPVSSTRRSRGSTTAARPRTALPFLVMEYVEGLPLDVYCERNRLGIEARLRLFRRLLDAVPTRTRTCSSTATSSRPTSW